ncbi:MAG: HAD family hydrolase, partial [Candidatus Dormibacteraceae bacterium]
MGVGAARYEAIVFDLDDTLIVEEAVAQRSLRAAAALLPGLDPDLVRETVLRHARRLWRAGPHHPICQAIGVSSWEGLWSSFSGGHPDLDGLRGWSPTYAPEVWQAALAELGIDEGVPARRLDEAYRRAQWDGHTAIEGAQPLVRDLRRAGIGIGLLTNGLADIQRRKLEHAGLTGCFDAIVVSGEVGVGKPDRAVFELVRADLGVDPSSLLMVGDSWSRDVRGALAAGWSAVWVAGGPAAPA